VDFYHFLILSTVVLSLTCISIVSTRINMAKRWCDAMGRGSTGERQTSTDGYLRKRKGKDPWTVSHWFHSNPVSLQCYDIFLCNTCCRYSMINGVVDSRHVRAQKTATTSQSTGVGSSFFSHQSEIEQLKETLRQRMKSRGSRWIPQGAIWSNEIAGWLLRPGIRPVAAYPSG
jgi:hypothetical protein